MGICQYHRSVTSLCTTQRAFLWFVAITGNIWRYVYSGSIKLMDMEFLPPKLAHRDHQQKWVWRCLEDFFVALACGNRNGFHDVPCQIPSGRGYRPRIPSPMTIFRCVSWSTPSPCASQRIGVKESRNRKNHRVSHEDHGAFRVQFPNPIPRSKLGLTFHRHRKISEYIN